MSSNMGRRGRRSPALNYEELARKIDAMERKYEAQFKVVFDAIRELMKPDLVRTRRIGFKSDHDESLLSVQVQT